MTDPVHTLGVRRWRYVPYWIGVKLGSPPRGTYGHTFAPLSFTEWKRWFLHGY